MKSGGIRKEYPGPMKRMQSGVPGGAAGLSLQTVMIQRTIRESDRHLNTLIRLVK